MKKNSFLLLLATILLLSCTRTVTTNQLNQATPQKQSLKLIILVLIPMVKV
jgi:hypothetical protein